ncbi:NADAR family protein [Spartinivicinus ruber]|uniref:NADAR family protein n=1 Tax=Spartinivicinus ruber TaxID=2683272 RepID=UPI0013D7963B|nr:NADAR family protein [Spartinivicinus ruber]
MKIYNKQQLIDFINHNGNVKYLFFWGHRKTKSAISKTCFSQWYECSFIVNNIEYPTAEHYMMAEKARLFNDHETLQKILAAESPGEAKKLGRNVTGFDENIWINKRFSIVVKSNIAKFNQNPNLKEFLLNTGNRVLVEASPVDKIWGIGLPADYQYIENPYMWKGLNLLGFALMEVRNQLKTSRL